MVRFCRWCRENPNWSFISAQLWPIFDYRRVRAYDRHRQRKFWQSQSFSKVFYGYCFDSPQVLQVRKRDTSRIYALKTIRKAHIVNRNEITHTLAERLVLAQVNSPFIVPLKFSFQSEQKLYLVLA